MRSPFSNSAPCSKNPTLLLNHCHVSLLHPPQAPASCSSGGRCPQAPAEPWPPSRAAQGDGWEAAALLPSRDPSQGDASPRAGLWALPSTARLGARRPTAVAGTPQQLLLPLSLGAADPRASFGPASWGTRTAIAAAAQSPTQTSLSRFAAQMKNTAYL